MRPEAPKLVVPQNALFLAPMAGVTDAPFRALCVSQGADFTVTEMVSAKGVVLCPKEREEVAWLKAVSQGNYYQTPYGPYGWLSSPPSVQRYLGLLWLGALLCPDYINYDLQEEVTEYYKLFYDCDLTDEMYQELIQYAMPQ